MTHLNVTPPPPPFGTDADIIATRANALANAVPLADIPPQYISAPAVPPTETKTDWLNVTHFNCKHYGYKGGIPECTAHQASCVDHKHQYWACNDRKDTGQNPFFCTIFTSLQAQKGKAIRGTHCGFRVLGWMLANVPGYTQKNKQPLIKMGRYESNSRAAGFNLVSFSGLELDHDAGTMTMAQAIAVLTAFGINHIIYPTYTSTSTHPKWRALIQVSRPIKAKYRKAFVEVLSDLLGAGVVSPESFRDKQLMFIGRKAEPDGYQVYGHYTARCMDQVEWMFDRVVAAQERMEAETTRARQTLTFKPKPVRNNTNGQIDVITAFNESYDVGAILLNAGYASSGSRYVSPLSTSGLAGVNLLTDGQDGRERAYSHHSNCPLNNGHANDAFDCFQILEHGNDQTAALIAASRVLWHNGRTLEEHNGELFKKSRAADNLHQINPMAINVWGKVARALVDVPNGRQLFESWAGAAFGVMWANLTAKGALDAGVLYHLAKDYPRPPTAAVLPPPPPTTTGTQS